MYSYAERLAAMRETKIRHAAAMAEQAHIADILGFVAHVVYSPYI